MITSILEFRFSNHYFNDIDNRFKLRVKDAIIINDFKNKERAISRFRQVMYKTLLTQFDKMETLGAKHINYGLVIGEVVFIENKQIVPGIIKTDNNTGNLYVAIIKNNTVVTLLLLNNKISNEDLLKKLNAHNIRTGTTEITTIKNLNGVEIPLNAPRPKIVVNLDITDAEFYDKFPAPLLSNNNYSINGFSKSEFDANDAMVKTALQNKVVMAGHALSADMKQYVPEKEWSIKPGTKVLVRYPDSIKEKTVDEIIIDETGSSRKYSLRFKNTAAIYPLNVNSNFIISPTTNSETYTRLRNAFELKPDAVLNFEGPIKRFMDYMKKHGSLGIIIDPKSLIY